MNNRYAESRILGILASELAEVGDLAEARDAQLEALRLAREAGDRQDEVHRLFGLGRVDRLMGRYTDARARFQDSLALAREIGDRDGEAFATRGLGTVAARTGDADAATSLCQKSVALGDELSGPSERARDRLCLGDARRSAGDAVGALHAYREAAAIVPESDTGLAMEVAAATAQILLTTGELAAAVDAVEPILGAFAEGLPDGIDEPARVELACVEVLMAARDPRARSVLDRANARLDERAGRLQDDDRRTFLTAIAEHRELRRLREEHHAKAGSLAD
jgi:tetratricopeptide (TPR) repeat protein